MLRARVRVHRAAVRVTAYSSRLGRAIIASLARRSASTAPISALRRAIASCVLANLLDGLRLQV
jgi:hypothetical protein